MLSEDHLLPNFLGVMSLRAPYSPNPSSIWRGVAISMHSGFPFKLVLVSFCFLGAPFGVVLGSFWWAVAISPQALKTSDN